MLMILLTTIIAIEGGMGSGKTTLSNSLKKQSSKFKFFPESIQYLTKTEYDELWTVNGTTRAPELLFESEIRRKQDILKYKYKDGDIVILDRSYLTFAAYEYAKANKDGPNNFNRMFSIYKERMAIPNYIIFLTVNPALRIQRVTARGDKNLPDNSMIHAKFNDGIANFFRTQHYIKVFFIDTTAKTPEEVSSDTLKIIQ